MQGGGKDAKRISLRLFKGKVKYRTNIADDFKWMFSSKRQDELDAEAPETLDLPEWKRWLSGFNFKMEFYPANGQGYIYDNSYTKQYGLERGLHIGIYDVNIGFEYVLPLTKARTRAGNPRAELALQTELYGCRHFSAGLQLKVHLK